MQVVSDLTTLAKVREVVQHREAMRTKFSEFFVRGFQTIDPGAKYKHNWHIDCVCEHAQAVYEKQIPKLIVNIPPRFLKSSMISVAWPAWILGLEPSQRIIAASGVASLATRFSDDTRKILNSEWYKALFPRTNIRPGQNEKRKFETTMHGHRFSSSVGSKNITGEGGNYGAIDDPIDPESTFSITELEACIRWYDLTWSTRFNDPELALQILVMQRLHRGDLTQHLLDMGGWHHLKLPQEAPTQVVVKFPISGREVVRGKKELIHADRFGDEARRASRITLGEYGYAAQQQQEPVAKGGNRIKMHWFKQHQVDPIDMQRDECILSFDTASKGAEINNPTVCMAFVRKDTQWYLGEIKRKKLVYPDLKRLLLSMEAKWKPNAILIEDKSSGTQLLQEAADLKIHTTVAIEPHGDKPARMELELPAVENGIISLPDQAKVKSADWMHDFEGEIMEFPMCLTFDQIDALSQFLMHIRLNKVTGPLLW